jgi:energy-converting hydrogenase Eha subunit E
VLLAPAIVVSGVGLSLLVLPWPVPMAGLAFICVGAWLGLSAARASRRRAR